MKTKKPEMQPHLFEKPEIKITKSSTEVNEKGIGSCLLELKISNKKYKVTVIRQSDGHVWIVNASEKFSYADEQRIIELAQKEFEKKILEKMHPSKPKREPRECPKCGLVHPGESCSEKTFKRIIQE